METSWIGNAIGASGDHDHREAWNFLLNLRRQLFPGHSWHLKIGYDYVPWPGPELREALIAVGGCTHLVTGPLQLSFEKFEKQRRVVYDKNAS